MKQVISNVTTIIVFAIINRNDIGVQLKNLFVQITRMMWEFDQKQAEAVAAESTIVIGFLQSFISYVGVDECGRGALCGPVQVCAFYCPLTGQPIKGVNDSKKLSASARLKLFKQLNSEEES